MSSPFIKVYPSTGDGRVTLDGGLNSKFPRALIQDNESPDCLNVIFNDGAVETREGTTKLNTAAIASVAIDGLYTRRANDDSETMIAFANGSAWDLQTTSFITIGSAQSVFTAGNRVAAAMYENHLFCGNGGVIPYKYDGDFTRHGVYPPTTTHTAATNSNGTLTGDYQYKITFVNSLAVESDVGPVNSTFAAASEEVLLSSIPVAPQSFGIDARKVYRTENGGSTFKLVDTINNNTATTYVDNTSDSALGANAPTDNGVPALYGVVAYHQDRLFTDDPTQTNYLRYSELGNPYVFKVTNFIRIGDNTSDILRGVVSYNNGIIATGDRTMTFVYMPDTTASNWITVVLKSPYGSKSPFGLIPFQDRLIFPATQNGEFVGIGSLLGTTLEPDVTLLTVMAAGGELQSTKIEDQMFQVQRAYLKNVTSIAHKNKVYISVTYGSGATTNNRIYVLNYEQDNLSKVQKYSWSLWTGTPLNTAQFTEYAGDLYAATSDATGFVYKLNDGTYTDDGSAIDSYYWTKEFSGFKGDEQFHKDHRFLNLMVENSGNWPMDVLVRTDSDKGSGDTYVVDLDPAGSEWNSLVWGTDTWGGGVDEKDVKLFIGTQRGKRVQAKFTNQNTLNQKFKVFWLKHAYNLKGYR
jgi:hypothetical protein